MGADNALSLGSSRSSLTPAKRWAAQMAVGRFKSERQFAYYNFQSYKTDRVPAYRLRLMISMHADNTNG